MALKLDNLPRSQSLVDGQGKPLTAFQVWWQAMKSQIETSVNNISDIVGQITAILVRLGLVEITADGALQLADSAINPDGTIKDEKVLTPSIIADGVTVPWFVSSTTVINFPGSPTVTDILVQSIAKDIDESDLEVETQIELFGNDAVNIDISCQILDASASQVAVKDYRVQVDGNSVTHMPLAYKFIFQGIDSGDYTVKVRGARYNSNTVNTVGDYFMAVREFKR